MSLFLFPYLRAQPIRPAYRGMRATGKIGQLCIYDNTATCNLYCIIIGICNSSYKMLISVDENILVVGEKQ